MAKRKSGRGDESDNDNTRGTTLHFKPRPKSKSREKQNANLQRAGGQAPNSKPTVTVALAESFVRILASGLPPSDALAHIAPDYHRSLTAKALGEWVSEVMSDPRVVLATESWQGGKWEELPPDRRLTVAQDLYLAQCAYFLYSHNVADLGVADLKKAESAATTIRARLSIDDDGATPFGKVMRKILAGELKAETMFAGPPVMQEPEKTE